MDEYYEPVEDPDRLTPHTVIRRSGSRHQQGRFIKKHADGSGLVVMNVFDPVNHEFVAEAGVIKPDPTDQIFRLRKHFSEDPVSDQARQILRKWILFREHVELQQEFLETLECSYGPEQILTWHKQETLQALFIPLQQKYKIGKFKEKIDWDKVRTAEFAKHIDALYEGKHITYVAFIPTDTNHEPMFYSYGTKPHLETVKQLEREAFAFKPTHGGHLKIISARGEPKKFVVDAGSNDLGRGIYTSLATAEMVTHALQYFFPDYEFVPLPGRQAYGVQQSY